MGELLGIPEWLALTLFIAAFFVVLGTVAWRNTNRQIERTLGKRNNLTREEFIMKMTPDVTSETSGFLWDSAMSYLEVLKQEITPHPDDHLVDDLPIDDEEWSMDWPREWAERKSFHESNLPDWPEDWAVTIRNYGRWLDMCPATD
ncbi:hypothetical protein [Altererythrobacter sp. MF3-039]|uniref:hypothetical protein n=1 Tax=Altererythrobacter sp. MF3-039 TaxID=3252901 RepID=UPI00390CC3D2